MDTLSKWLTQESTKSRLMIYKKIFPFSRFCFVIFVLSGLPLQTIDAAQWRVSTGIEYFNWQENEATGREIVKESGPRAFLEIGAREDLDNITSKPLFFSFITRLYAANVTYTGETTGTTTPIPILSDSLYAGWSGEVQSHFILLSTNEPSNKKDWYLSLSLGYEEWLRDIQDAKLSDITISGYPEVYQVSYLKIGFLRNSNELNNLKFGIKFPFNIDETIGWESSGYINPMLKPSPAISFYLGYLIKLSKSWGLHLFFDSYRFEPSDKEPLYALDGTSILNSEGNQAYVYQPKSSQDSVGALITYRF